MQSFEQGLETARREAKNGHEKRLHRPIRAAGAPENPRSTSHRRKGSTRARASCRRHGNIGLITFGVSTHWHAAACDGFGETDTDGAARTSNSCHSARHLLAGLCRGSLSIPTTRNCALSEHCHGLGPMVRTGVRSDRLPCFPCPGSDRSIARPRPEGNPARAAAEVEGGSGELSPICKVSNPKPRCFLLFC